jgi:hypothetical protein
MLAVAARAIAAAGARAKELDEALGDELGRIQSAAHCRESASDRDGVDGCVDGKENAPQRAQPRRSAGFQGLRGGQQGFSFRFG